MFLCILANWLHRKASKERGHNQNNGFENKQLLLGLKNRKQLLKRLYFSKDIENRTKQNFGRFTIPKTIDDFQN